MKFYYFLTHGDITIKINETPNLPALSEDDVSLDSDVSIGLKSNKISTKKGSSTVANIARSLQKLGAKPKDIIAILEAIKKAGAIKAKLEVI